MDLSQALRVAATSLRSNKLRSSLTMLGMAIGVGAVILLTAIGNGVQNSITTQFNSLGTNLVFVSPGTTRAQGAVAAQAGAVQTITYDDAKAIADPTNVPSALIVSPEVTVAGQFIAQGQNTTGNIDGVTAAYGALHNYQVGDGVWIDDAQVDSSANVVVLGATVAQTLFQGVEPVGQQVRIDAIGGRSGAFTVVGVGEKKGGSSFNNPDTAVYLPLTAVLNKLSRQVAGTGAQTVNVVAVQAVDRDAIQSLQDEITRLLLQRHHIVDPSQADFTVTSLQDQLKSLQQVTGIFTLFLGAVAGISLLVGGIGIMNIMIVSVTERTREIGIRKAAGAKRRDILTQFLVESVVVSLFGGSSGILGGVILARIASSFNVNGNPFPMAVSLQSVILAAGICGAIGVFFGLYPAMRAARMRPIEALRYE
jgi:putative ABC transport system permease protein